MQVKKKDTDAATAETCLKGVVYRWIKGWCGNTLLKRDANSKFKIKVQEKVHTMNMQCDSDKNHDMISLSIDAFS